MGPIVSELLGFLAQGRRHLCQAVDPLRDRRMRREQRAEPHLSASLLGHAAEGIGDEQGRRRLTDLHRVFGRSLVELGKGAGQGERRAGQLGTGTVRFELAGPADRHPDDQGDDGGDDDRRQTDDGGERVVPAAASASHPAPERHPGEERQGDADGGCNRADEDVAVLDVGQLMGENTLELLVVEGFDDARGHRHRGVFRVSPRSKGIRLFGVDEVDVRHRHPRAHGE